ncbi:hypothetical protein T440DRAFT_120789 [Plenodomus tracheiphilus IPT5]|uniref:Saponin hydrolase n=1 Tax=Plenodomus tracheiphilus IPT5 TaxID=1408161 RepID=A0A6A7B6R0_9PLEO|nr:hypothetical protein T440DRAFT_120789 [Plenodomus tracheiphilus IPT5]
MYQHSSPIPACLLVFILTVFGRILPSSAHFNAGHLRKDAHQLVLGLAQETHCPPEPEPIHIVELPLPPVSVHKERGACTTRINPHGTGCISQTLGEYGGFQAGDFTPDGTSVVATVEFVGAPISPYPASIYDGLQIILVKTDGTNFSNGDSWKCLSCAVPRENMIALDPKRDYPHVFRSGDRAIWGHNVLDCDGEPLGSDSCTPARIHIYPIYWAGGAPRELRVHPDDDHIGRSSFTNQGGQNCFFGRLQFVANPMKAGPKAPRYDLVDIDLLVDPTRGQYITTTGQEMHLHPESITVGELRGFSGTGDEITYIGAPTESNNLDLYAVHIETGVVRRLTSHPDYVDPISFSADDQWFVVQDTRATERQMWMSGMRGLPPVIDIIATIVAASTRNNGRRRFFQPILIDRYGDRDGYFGQLLNAEGDHSEGSINDPNWNGRADPAFSLDGTRIVFWQSIVTSPSCGGSNPLQCPSSTAQGGREYRVMLAHLTSRTPQSLRPVHKVPVHIPWASPFPHDVKGPKVPDLVPGNYTLHGAVSGKAHVQLIGADTIDRVIVNYLNYSADETHTLNGWEDVELSIVFPNVWRNMIS